MQFFYRFIADERASVSMEYVVIAAFASVTIAGAAWTIGERLAPIFTGLAPSLK